MPPSTAIETPSRGVPGLSERDEVIAYLLGLGSYAYPDGFRYAEEYHRLHEAIRALARAPDDEAEAAILRCGAQLRQADRVLAALFVEGGLACLADPGGWPGITEEIYFQVALESGMLTEFVSFDGPFAVPPTADRCDPTGRYRCFAVHFLGLPEGPSRQGLRLALLRLFDRTEDDVAAGLALVEYLRRYDAPLRDLAAARIVLAFQREEPARYAPAYHDLVVRLVATAGRWELAAARPHLRCLLEQTPPRTRQSRVLRATLARTIEQLCPE